MKTKGDTVTCSQAPDLIANMLYQLTIRLPSSGQHAFVESASSKIAASRRTCNAFFHICTTSLRMKCAGIGGLTTEVTVSLCSSLAYCVELCQRSASHPAAFSHTLAGWPLFTPYSNERHYHLLQQELPRNVGAGGAPLHRLTAVPLALSGEASLCCNVCYNQQGPWLP